MDPESSGVVLGRRRFTDADQRAFAALSRDFNPVHVDPVAARRLVSGRPLVHGIHTLMCGLDLWARNDARTTASALACRFVNPIGVGDEVVFASAPTPAGGVSIEGCVEGLACIHIEITAAEAQFPAPVTPAPVVDGCPIETDVPLDEPAGSQVGCTYSIADWDVPLDSRFPHALRRVGRDRLAALAKLSYFVGMICPGLHSVFSELRLQPQPGSGSALSLRIERYDARFRLFTVSFHGTIAGTLKAFARARPQLQPSCREISGQVRAQEFQGRRALVIGGSRGLGEVTAKILGVGGAEVTLTYAEGASDAERVVDDVAACRRGQARAVRLDLRHGRLDDLNLDRGSLDVVYYFATPRIFRKKAAVFDRRIFAEFCWFYLERFHDLCQWLEAGAGKPVTVFLPSTAFIDERPKGMTEYTMAKVAAEVLAADLRRSLRRVRIVSSRLPRMATDQTASILDLTTAFNVEALLAVVRRTAGQPNVDGASSDEPGAIGSA